MRRLAARPGVDPPALTDLPSRPRKCGAWLLALVADLCAVTDFPGRPAILRMLADFPNRKRDPARADRLPGQVAALHALAMAGK